VHTFILGGGGFYITGENKIFSSKLIGNRGGTVVKAVCYKSEGCWFDPRWYHCVFLLTLNPSDRTMALGLTQPVTETSTRSISWG